MSSQLGKERSIMWRHFRRFWWLYAILAVISVGATFVDDINRWDAHRTANGQARDSMVREYASQLAADTQGIIAIDVMGDGNDGEGYINEYTYNGSSHTLGVFFTLGGCSELHGTFRGVPAHPLDVTDIGEMYFDLPSVDAYTQSSTVSVRDAHLAQKLKVSALAHCASGDLPLGDKPKS